jgi:hypothetical protein
MAGRKTQVRRRHRLGVVNAAGTSSAPIDHGDGSAKVQYDIGVDIE